MKIIIILFLSLNIVNSEIFNIRDYGATGDGVTDDTRSVLKAIANCTRNGGVLYIPSGTYVITSTLTFNTNNPFTIQGDGMNSILYWQFNNHLIVLSSGVFSIVRKVNEN